MLQRHVDEPAIDTKLKLRHQIWSKARKMASHDYWVWSIVFKSFYDSLINVTQPTPAKKICVCFKGIIWGNKCNGYWRLSEKHLKSCDVKIQRRTKPPPPLFKTIHVWQIAEYSDTSIGVLETLVVKLSLVQIRRYKINFPIILTFITCQCREFVNVIFQLLRTFQQRICCKAFEVQVCTHHKMLHSKGFMAQ